MCLIPGWHKNNQSPRLSVSATIVAKRENITHYNHANAGDLSGAHGFHSTSSTSYYVTFQVVAEMGLLTNTVALAGMNLPMALTAVLAGPDVELDMLAETLSGEACNGVEEFVIPADEDEDEDL